jgi:hypothetical protein
LTASHVAKALKAAAMSIVFTKPNDKPYRCLLSALMKGNDWKHHSIADISLIQLLPFNQDIENRLMQWSFPSNQILKEQQLPSRDTELYFFGYPVTDLSLDNFSALTFPCHIASGIIKQNITYNNNICKVFYIDRPSIQGASGSPVYFSVLQSIVVNGSDRTFIIGIITETRSDNTGGKLGMVIHSSYIWDLVNLN